MATETASTWPRARDLTISNVLAARHNDSPRSTRRMVSICSSESADRLARVRLRTRSPSRNDSRNRYVGRAWRFGTASMCMGASTHHASTTTPVAWLH